MRAFPFSSVRVLNLLIGHHFSGIGLSCSKDLFLVSPACLPKTGYGSHQGPLIEQLKAFSFPSFYPRYFGAALLIFTACSFVCQHLKKILKLKNCCILQDQRFSYYFSDYNCGKSLRQEHINVLNSSSAFFYRVSSQSEVTVGFILVCSNLTQQQVT